MLWCTKGFLRLIICLAKVSRSEDCQFKLCLGVSFLVLLLYTPELYFYQKYTVALALLSLGNGGLKLRNLAQLIRETKLGKFYMV